MFDFFGRIGTADFLIVNLMASSDTASGLGEMLRCWCFVVIIVGENRKEIFFNRKFFQPHSANLYILLFKSSSTVF